MNKIDLLYRRKILLDKPQELVAQQSHAHGYMPNNTLHVDAYRNLENSNPLALADEIIHAPANTYGIMILGHGSRDRNAITEFKTMVQELSQHYAPIPTRYGFLEFANPIITTGLDELRQLGVKHILAVPALLFAAGHAKNDMPSVLNRYQKAHPEILLQYGRELALDPRLLQVAAARILSALPGVFHHLNKNAQQDYLSETVLIVVGRGASDPDANSSVAKVMRFLWEGLGFGLGFVAYSGVTFPLVEPALRMAAHLPYKRFLVFPYFLFSGILVDRIYESTDRVAADTPEKEFIKAGYLNNHRLVLNTITSRLNEILQGTGVMNCQLCKYRQQVLGFEDEVGLAQTSHHDHVEGIGVDDKTQHGSEHHHHSHYHEHGDHHIHHEHGDHEHHHPYPFASHPLGPNYRQLKK